MNTFSSYFNWTKVNSFLIHAVAIAAVAGASDLLSSQSVWTTPSWVTGAVGLILAQVVSGITGWIKNNPVVGKVA